MSEKGKTPEQFVEGLVVGSFLTDVPFILLSSQVRPKKTGGNYIAIVLGDKTGTVDGKVWSDHLAPTLKPGSVFFVKGKVTTFADKKQVEASDLVIADSGSYDQADFLFVNPQEIAHAMSVIRSYITVMPVEDRRGLKKLCFYFLDAFDARIKECSASRSKHHEYVGGLAIHVSQVMQLADRVCSIFPSLDQDVLLTASLLHDIGKLWELQSSGYAFDYTGVGKLMGHIFMGASIVDTQARELGVPAETANHVVHCILSHHGRREWGSPVEPLTPEAQALHFVDQISAKVTTFLKVQDIARRNDSRWSGWDRLTECDVWAGPSIGDKAIIRELSQESCAAGAPLDAARGQGKGQDVTQV